MSGPAGERRRNPFPSLNDTEYELLMEKIERAASAGAQKAIQQYLATSCEGHQERTEHLESTVFGRREAGVVGMDETLARHERQLAELLESIVWFKRLVYGATVSALVALLFAIAQLALTGR